MLLMLTTKATNMNYVDLAFKSEYNSSFLNHDLCLDKCFRQAHMLVIM